NIAVENVGDYLSPDPWFGCTHTVSPHERPPQRTGHPRFRRTDVMERGAGTAGSIRFAFERGSGETRQPLCKFVAASQREPAALHIEKVGLDVISQSSGSQPFAFLCAAVAVADFSTKVLKHGATRWPKCQCLNPSVTTMSVTAGSCSSRP